MKRRILASLAVFVFALVSAAHAHEARPGFLELRQTDVETYSFLWKKPTGGEVEIQIAPVVPEGCRLATPDRQQLTPGAMIVRGTLACVGGLTGKTIVIAGLEATITDVLVRVHHADGRLESHLLRPAGSDCFLMAYVHVAHDNRIGDGAILANNVMLAGHVEIGERAFLGGGSGVHQFCRVGRLAMVGGNAKVVQDCLPFVITDGHPARARGLNVVGLRRAASLRSNSGRCTRPIACCCAPACAWSPRSRRSRRSPPPWSTSGSPSRAPRSAASRTRTGARATRRRVLRPAQGAR